MAKKVTLLSLLKGKEIKGTSIMSGKEPAKYTIKEIHTAKIVNGEVLLLVYCLFNEMDQHTLIDYETGLQCSAPSGKTPKTLKAIKEIDHVSYWELKLASNKKADPKANYNTVDEMLCYYKNKFMTKNGIANPITNDIIELIKDAPVETIAEPMDDMF